MFTARGAKDRLDNVNVLFGRFFLERKLDGFAQQMSE